VAESRVEAARGYWTLGPSSDVLSGGSNEPTRGRIGLLAPVIAVSAGVILAVLVGSLGSAKAGRSRVSRGFSRQTVAQNSVQGGDALDRMQPQRQAETLLEQAVGRSGGAVEQISSRVDRWHGKLNWNSQIATLTTAALNSDDRRVRESGIEVELAAYGLSKNSASLEYLILIADSEGHTQKDHAQKDHAQKVWALWALGLMGNRGVGSARVVDTLTRHLKDSEEDSRRWAVEGLALVGSAESMAPLLQSMHDDSSPSVREAAACALAQSGMFTAEQRMAIVPQLLAYTDDPALDAQTRAWAYQALGDITRQHLPNDSAAWRGWYSTQSE